MNVLIIFSKCAKHPPAWRCELVLQTSALCTLLQLATGDGLEVRPLVGTPVKI
jgi:hypothetical protein